MDEEQIDPKKIEPKTTDIGYFRVTDRSFRDNLYFSDLDTKFINSLPQGSVVVEMGSGLHSYFARGIKDMRGDLLVIPIDPTLGLDKKKFISISLKNDTGLRQVEYSIRRDDDESQKKYADSSQKEVATREERVKIANETRNIIAAVAPSVPVEPNSVSLFIDNYSAGMYLDDEDLDKYVVNIFRALASDGLAIIFPLDTYNDVFSSLYNQIPEERNTRFRQIWIERIEKLITVFKLVGLEFEFYTKLDPNKKKVEIGDSDETVEYDNYRLGIKITKVT